MLLGFGRSAWAQPDFRHPPRQYVSLRQGGRSYFVEQNLSPQRAQAAVNRLDTHLRASIQLLPSHSRPALRRLPVFVLEGPAAPGGGKDNGLEYFRQDAPDHFKTLDPRWRDCIVCYCAQNYQNISDLWAAKSVLHELAHAYDLENFPENQPDIVLAWKHARAQGLYRQVVDEEGQVLSQAYALTNPLEYFAELSVMAFGRCNYAPVDRAALRRYDPVGFSMIRKMWRLRLDHNPPNPPH